LALGRPCEFRAGAAEQERRLRNHIAFAWESLTDQQQSKVSAQFRELSRQACGLAGPGDDPGSETSRLAKGAGRQPWQALLRRYVGRQLERRPKFSRPPRRFPQLAGLVPGWGRSGAKPRILAAIDTSGSLTDEMLAEISAELALMARRFDVTVAECDTRIHVVYPYRPITSVHGRGGTDLRPPLQQEFLRKHKADLVVYFTDGFGPAPAKPPRIPVIWCLTEAGVKPAAWGAEIKMQGAKNRPSS